MRPGSTACCPFPVGLVPTDDTHGSGNISNNTCMEYLNFNCTINVGLTLLEQFGFLTPVYFNGLFYIIGR